MTVLELVRPEPAAPRHALVEPRHREPSTLWWRLGLAVVLIGQVALSFLPARIASAFEDEGLYVYMGHRMLEHFSTGAALSEYPGAYFSGAPGFYPVLAALGDDVAGLPGARAVSLTFALLATVCVNGLGRQLYGRPAGLLGAAAFVLCGSVIFQSGLATFDSTTLFFVAAACWLTVYSVQHDSYLWAPVVSVLLVAGFVAKYGGIVYLPVVALLAVAVSAHTGRNVPLVVRRACFMVGGAVVVAFALYTLWGQSLREGIISTTLSRAPMNPASAWDLITQVGLWAGLWLLLALIGAVVSRRTWMISLVLMLGSVIVPLQQIRIGEATSLSKHVAFGMVFAAPLIGVALAAALRRFRPLPIPLVAAVLVVLGVVGLHWSDRFLNGWVSNQQLVPVLSTLIDASPGKTILGDQPSAERYELREETTPLQWTDTYSFGYDNKTGMAAYETAIHQTAFGVIYLQVQSNTPDGAALYDYLQNTETPYKQVATVDRTLYGEPAGVWVLYMPEVTPTPDLGGVASAN